MWQLKSLACFQVIPEDFLPSQEAVRCTLPLSGCDFSSALPGKAQHNPRWAEQLPWMYPSNCRCSIFFLGVFFLITPMPALVCLPKESAQALPISTGSSCIFPQSCCARNVLVASPWGYGMPLSPLSHDFSGSGSALDNLNRAQWIKTFKDKFAFQ